MTKRNIFSELVEGIDALKSEREGKLTLRQVKLQAKPVPVLEPQEVLAVREQLHLSRTVFARYLRTNPRTLENWEQGRAKPNAQAALLIRMVAQFPDMVQRLEAVCVGIGGGVYFFGCSTAPAIPLTARTAQGF